MRGVGEVSLARVVSWLLVLTCSLVSCNRLIGLPDRHIDREPETAELVGSWRLTPASIENLKQEGFGRLEPAEHVLELRNGAQCTFHSYWSFGVPSEEYLEAPSCSWSVTRERAYIHHREAQVPVVALDLRRGDHYWSTSYYIVEERGELVLWSYVGDPDSRVYADWRR
jgi:hypothetical protein